MPKKTLKTSIPVHAKERLIERYDIKFSRKQENEFCRSLGGRNTVYLGGKRCAVYFDGTWFLLTLELNGTVSTFLSPAMLKPDEKTLLKNSTIYYNICKRSGNDPFEVGLTAPPLADIGIQEERKVPLPPLPDDNELPQDIALIEKLLE